MPLSETHIVTGAFGFTGRHLTHLLLAQGIRVRALTNSTRRQNPFGKSVEVFPLAFGDPKKLESALSGATVLHNTYWVRFNYGNFSYAQAVENSEILFRAAKNAGIARIVHISITNASRSSTFEYFRRKALVEEALIRSGISYAILRPSVLFGDEGILVNNIAWVLRRFPVFGIFGDGEYCLQPIYVDDLAGLMVEYAARRENTIVDGLGPEKFSFRELVTLIGKCIGYPRPIVRVPDWMGLAVSLALTPFTKDLLITRDEIKGLKANLLCTDSPPAGVTRLSDWVRENANWLGARYMSELSRRSP
ncbi:MAG: SDR family oxidoreductase [bacterium JZ-2024 1]